MTRIFSISDLHVDYKQNRDWLKNLSNIDYKNDYLIIAGDISDNPLRFTKTLTTLSEKFKGLFYVPGNHDLWIRKDEVKDSIEKFKLLVEICKEMGVSTTSEIILKTKAEKGSSSLDTREAVFLLRGSMPVIGGTSTGEGK